MIDGIIHFVQKYIKPINDFLRLLKGYKRKPNIYYSGETNSSREREKPLGRKSEERQ